MLMLVTKWLKTDLGGEEGDLTVQTGASTMVLYLRGKAERSRLQRRDREL